MTDRIESLTNPRIKRLVALRSRKARDAERVFVVEGARDLDRAVASGLQPIEVYYDPDLLPGPPERAEVIVAVSGPALNRASYRRHSQGVISVFPQPDLAIDRLTLTADPLILLAESVEKPGNLGALLRTADAVGADVLIAADPGTDPFNPNVIRASTGTIFSVPLAVTDIDTAVSWLRDKRVRLVAAALDSGNDLWSVDLTGPLALLVGSEHDGLSPSARSAADTTVTIPMKGAADSLNVSVSMAVLAYEAMRQRAGGQSPGH